MATVEVDPATQTINVGDSAFVHATKRDEHGVVIPGGVHWSVSDTSLVSVMYSFTSTYIILWGLASGTVTITATADDKSGTGTVVIN